VLSFKTGPALGAGAGALAVAGGGFSGPVCCAFAYVAKQITSPAQAIHPRIAKPEDLRPTIELIPILAIITFTCLNCLNLIIS
jgi:hypothetical protein